MANLLDFFDAAFLVNLPERTDRRQDAMAEFDRLGWPTGNGGVEFFPAIKPEDAAGFPSAAVRGCFLSHYECLKRARAEGCRNVLIMEDDITFSPAIPRVAPQVADRLSQGDWDLTFMGHYLTGDLVYANAGTTSVDLVPYHAQTRGTHFYCVAGPLLPRLLAHLDETAAGSSSNPDIKPMSIDGAYNVFRRLNPDVRTLLAQPQLGWQRFSPSDITPRRLDRIPVIRTILTAYRKSRNAIKRQQIQEGKL